MKSFKSCISSLLQEQVEAQGTSMSRQDAIAMAIIDKAMKGDLPAVNFIRELTEKKKADKAKNADEVVRVKVITEE